MASSHNHNKAWPNRITTSIRRISLTRSPDNDPERNLRRHWRPSLHKYSLPPLKPTKGHLSLANFLRPTQNRRGQSTPGAPPYLRLPPELRALVECFLTPADLVCLQQTCRQLRNEVYGSPGVRDLAPVHLYSLRRRLDRESFPLLRELESAQKLPYNVAVCKPCLTFHSWSYLRYEHWADRSSLTCWTSLRPFVICGSYCASASTLRDILDEIASNGTNRSIPHQLHLCGTIASKIYGGTRNFGLLDRNISRSTMFVNESGLVFEHHQHEATGFRGLPYSWNPRFVTYSDDTFICHHLSVYAARGKLGHWTGMVPTNSFSKCCDVEQCGTKFGLFECEDQRMPGVMFLCFRVQRVLGWLEDVPKFIDELGFPPTKLALL